MASVTSDDIFRALQALWKSKGATLTAIRAQPALVGLEHVVALAQDRSGDAEPSPDEIARACQQTIKDCTDDLPAPEGLSWDQRLQARILVGVEPGSLGANQRARRDRTMRETSISEEQLTHKRGGFSHELDCIRQTAEAVYRREAVYRELQRTMSSGAQVSKAPVSWVGRGDFNCERYHSDLVIHRGPYGQRGAVFVLNTTITVSPNRAASLRFPFSAVLLTGGKPAEETTSVICDAACIVHPSESPDGFSMRYWIEFAEAKGYGDDPRDRTIDFVFQTIRKYERMPTSYGHVGLYLTDHVAIEDFGLAVKGITEAMSIVEETERGSDPHEPRFVERGNTRVVADQSDWFRYQGRLGQGYRHLLRWGGP